MWPIPHTTPIREIYAPNQPEMYGKIPSFPKKSASRQVYGKTSPLSPLSLGYKDTYDHEPRIDSPWPAGSQSTVLTVFLASIYLSFLHPALSLENSFFQHHTDNNSTYTRQLYVLMFCRRSGITEERLQHSTDQKTCRLLASKECSICSMILGSCQVLPWGKEVPQLDFGGP